MTILWLQTLIDEFLDMPGPFEMLNPELLLMLGMGTIGTAVGLLTTAIMNARMTNEHMKMNQRTRYLFALSLGGTGIGGIHVSPLITEIYGYMSFVLLLLLPIGFSVLIIKELVRADI
ncbi:hypothetical protein [Haloarcula halophila]|uniref:hypothetical protein n=1 Tax=Haloarcula TaxID=2237 RepID=UPI0023E460B1|nr:hypothetical protein [Halomicroarcula sp. DFY41]